MARVVSKNTKPERAVRTALRSLGFRFRGHTNALPGTPDLVLHRQKSVILVHGCFWHRHQGCARTRVPRTRVSFWTTKFRQNVERDRTVRRALKGLGWRTLIVWECVAEDPRRLRRQLLRFLDGAP
jgi:DNA mismatch endonuclease (patch repair protein)